MSLKEYRAKRDFKRTAEPAGRTPPAHSQPIFVIQKHHATRLHYDLRLEMEGVLKSWAVPKGFPWKKGDKHLAVQVEDHPFDYKDFEGIIPENNYGAGTVLLWDTGTYRVGGEDPLCALKEGKLHLFFSGRKLKDEWTLVRLRKTERQDKPQWLLLKSGKDVRPLSARQDDTSVLSGRSMKQIGKAADRQWHSSRDLPIDIQKLSPAPAGYVEPMKALATRVAPRGEDWSYEIKFDGIRSLAVKHGNDVTLYSRTRNNLTAKYPQIARSIAEIPAGQIVLDGEIAALDEQGRSSFQLLQAYHASKVRPPLMFYAFDLLNLEERDLQPLPLTDRKALLEKLLADAPENIRFSPGLTGDVDRIVGEMRTRGLEGIIAKRLNSPYEAGRRSGAWKKFKWLNEQEFVIGGYTQPKGGRTFFGALLVGYYEGEKLLFAGKVGTGFDEATLSMLHKRFQPLVQADCPFANLPRPQAGKGGGLTRSQMKLCTWVQPSLVAQVKFSEWTRDRLLRQPSFVGLRQDKKPREVTL